MFELIDTISAWMPGYLLTFVRLTAMLLSMPVFGYATISPRIRILLGLVLTALVAPLIGAQDFVVDGSVSVLALSVMRELLVGLILGFGARFIFEGFTMAGSFIGLQMGFAIMQVFDPSTENQQPIISQFFLTVIVIVFLVTNSHYFLIEVLFENFKVIGLGLANFRPEVGVALLRGGSIIYDLAVRFAAPAMVLLLLIDVSLAFIARVMPQMNIFFIGLPLKIGVGMFMMLVSLKIFQTLFGVILDQLENYVFTLMHGMGTV